jgi:hypothetical protein
MKIGNRFVETGGVQIGELPLEKGNALSQKPRLFGGRYQFQGMGSFNKKIGPPPAPFHIPDPRLPVSGRNKRQHPAAPVRGSGPDQFFRDMAGYPFNVFHYLIGPDKDLFIDSLMGIPYANSGLIPLRPIGIVDMAATERFDKLKFSVNGKLVYRFPRKRRMIVH